MFPTVLALTLLSPGALAAATVSPCSTGDAPSPYDSAACTPTGAPTAICFIDGNGDVECDLSHCEENGTNATAVHDYADTGNHHFSAWGTYEGTDWCCVADDDPTTPTIDVFTLRGCDWSDEFLRFLAGSYNMEPHGASDLTGYIFGFTGPTDGDEKEDIDGSDYLGNDYVEFLYGYEGDDTINGHSDRDWIFGGLGEDVIHGGQGNDRIDGGGGVDAMYGDLGHDTICDTSADGPELMDGGAGDDKLWLDAGGSGWDLTNSTGGASMNDEWGDSGAGYTQPPGTETGISTRPGTCP